MRARIEGIAKDLLGGAVRTESGNRRPAQTRRAIEDGWLFVANLCF
jgi:hypothetical protein